MTQRFFFVTFLAGLCLFVLPFETTAQPFAKSGGMVAFRAAASTADFPPMAAPGKKVSIGKDYYFVYNFDKKPKLGTVIVRVEVFTADGKRDTSFEVKGDCGMPSMKGAHDMGEQPFKLSKSGTYLLPIQIVMPGDWEIRLTFLKNGQVVFRGSHSFDV